MRCSFIEARALLSFASLSTLNACSGADALLSQGAETFQLSSSTTSLSSLTAAAARPPELEGKALSLEEENALRACQTACKVQAACSLDLELLCNANCERAIPVLRDHQCLAQAASESDCLASMECRELRQYSNDGRRMNEKCGDRARTFFNECTVGNGSVPVSCTEMCRRFRDCERLQIAVDACEETCVANATGLWWSRGLACSDAFVQFAGCVATTRCEEIETLIDQREAPRTCRAEDAAFNAACGE